MFRRSFISILFIGMLAPTTLAIAAGWLTDTALFAHNTYASRTHLLETHPTEVHMTLLGAANRSDSHRG